MIEELLPGSVVTVEAYGHDEPENTMLYPEEEAVVAQAVRKRRREFAVVRSCARRAMEKLGVPPHPVLPGERGAPQWPAGLTGSMTHCDGYGAAALVRATDLASLGIDAEPDGPLPDGVLDAVALPAERTRLLRLTHDHPAAHWDRLLFSAKESVYKAWFPSLSSGSTSPRPTSRSASTRASRCVAPSAPNSSSPGRWWAADGSGSSTAVGPSGADCWRRPSSCRTTDVRSDDVRRDGLLRAFRTSGTYGSGGHQVCSSRKNASSLPVSPA